MVVGKQAKTSTCGIPERNASRMPRRTVLSKANLPRPSASECGAIGRGKARDYAKLPPPTRNNRALERADCGRNRRTCIDEFEGAWEFLEHDSEHMHLNFLNFFSAA